VASITAGRRDLFGSNWRPRRWRDGGHASSSLPLRWRKGRGWWCPQEGEWKRKVGADFGMSGGSAATPPPLPLLHRGGGVQWGGPVARRMGGPVRPGGGRGARAVAAPEAARRVFRVVGLAGRAAGCGWAFTFARS